MSKPLQHRVSEPGSQTDERHLSQPSNPPRPGKNPSRPAGNERSHPLNHPIRGGDTSLAPGGSKMGKHGPYESCSYITSPGQGAEPDAKFVQVGHDDQGKFVKKSVPGPKGPGQMTGADAPKAQVI